jgi:hypothetical protein
MSNVVVVLKGLMLFTEQHRLVDPPYWAAVDTTQTPSWDPVSTTQTPNWTPVSTN